MYRHFVAPVVLLSALLSAHLQAQTPERTLTLPENLVAQDVPPIPLSLVESVRRYTESRSASFADWHPTRREMIISTRFANAPQLHRVKTPLGARYQLTFFDEPVGGASYDERDGRFLIFGKDVGGNEFG